MSGSVTRKMADQTWEIRSKMDELVRAGVPEDKAVEELMAKDPDRGTKLKVWKERGLWPVAQEERALRTAEEGMLPDPDLMSPACSRDDEDSPGVCSCASESEMPAGLMENLLGSLRVTINAAIMDYHNVQITQMEEEIANLKERISKLEKRHEDGEPPAANDTPSSMPGGPSPGVRQTQDISPLPVRELVPPPIPATVFGSREQVSARARLAATSDRALIDIFERDRRARGYDLDEMLDFVLYNFYDRPALSFQMTPPDK